MQQTLLQSLLPGWCLRVREQTLSTNEDAKLWLRQGGPLWSAVFADRQTAGKGRMGRRFESGEGGLYFSLLLPAAPAGQVTTLCATAVVEALASVCGMQAQIKWVNDVLVLGKKVCGILCESLWQGEEPLGLIAGIGLNVCQRLPESLLPIAASLYTPEEVQPEKERIAAAICSRIREGWPRMPAHMALYRARCTTLGQPVAWHSARGEGTGVAEDVDDTGALLVRLPEGGSTRLFSGEVTLHRDGSG